MNDAYNKSYNKGEPPTALARLIFAAVAYCPLFMCRFLLFFVVFSLVLIDRVAMVSDAVAEYEITAASGPTQIQDRRWRIKGEDGSIAHG